MKLEWKITGKVLDLYLIILCQQQLIKPPFTEDRLSITNSDKIRAFWSPDLVISNAKKSSHDAKGGTALEMRFDHLLDSKRRRLTAKYQESGKAVVRCAMTFDQYPNDRQTCFIELRSRTCVGNNFCLLPPQTTPPLLPHPFSTFDEDKNDFCVTYPSQKCTRPTCSDCIGNRCPFKKQSCWNINIISSTCPTSI